MTAQDLKLFVQIAENVNKLATCLVSEPVIPA